LPFEGLAGIVDVKALSREESIICGFSKMSGDTINYYLLTGAFEVQTH
jgi:hypothetical protein